MSGIPGSSYKNRTTTKTNYFLHPKTNFHLFGDDINQMKICILKRLTTQFQLLPHFGIRDNGYKSYCSIPERVQMHNVLWLLQRVSARYMESNRIILFFRVLSGDIPRHTYFPCFTATLPDLYKAILQQIRNSLAIPLRIPFPRKSCSLKNISSIATLLCNTQHICKIQGEKSTLSHFVRKNNHLCLNLSSVSDTLLLCSQKSIFIF